MISKHGMIWEDGTPLERVAAARKEVERLCAAQFDDKRCPRNAFCVHEIQCPGTQRRT